MFKSGLSSMDEEFGDYANIVLLIKKPCGIKEILMERNGAVRSFEDRRKQTREKERERPILPVHSIRFFCCFFFRVTIF